MLNILDILANSCYLPAPSLSQVASSKQSVLRALFAAGEPDGSRRPLILLPS